MADTSTQTQTPSDSMNPQVMAVIQQLAQMAQQGQQGGQGQPAMSMANGGVGDASGQQISPYQKGVHKALQESGYNHATEALSFGMNPQDILNHPATTGQPPMSMTGGGVNQAGLQALQGMMKPQAQGTPQPQGNQGNIGIGTPQTPSPNIQPPTNAFQNTAYNPQTGQIQEGGWANRGMRGLAEGGIPGLLQGLLGPSLGAQMGATKEAQVLKAGQPSEIAKPQAEASESGARGGYFNALNKQVSQIVEKGGPPLSPEEKANLTAGVNNLQIKQITDLQDNLQKQEDVNSKTLDDLITKMPQSQKITDWTNWTNKVRSLQGKGQKINELMGMVNENLKNKQFTNPVTGQAIGGSNNVITDAIRSKAPAGSTHYDPPSGKYYDIQGNEVK